MARRTLGPGSESNTLAAAWSLLEASPAEAAVQFEAIHREEVRAENRDAACLAWCGAVASRFHTRDFALAPALLDGWNFALQEFKRLQEAVQAHVAVSIYAVACIAGYRAADRAEWKRMAIACMERAGSDDAWLALGVAMAGDALWLGAPVAGLSEVAPKIDAIAQRRRMDRSAAGWIAGRLHCALLFADPRLDFSASGTQAAIQAGIERGDADDMALASAILVQNLTRNRLDEARAFFQHRAIQATQLPAYDAWLLSFYKTWYCIEAADVETAMLDAARGLTIAERSGVPQAMAWAKLAIARTLADPSETRKVWRYIAAARQSARRIDNRPLAALSRLAAALCALRRGKARAAAVLAHAGLQAIEDSSLFHPPLFRRRDLELLFHCSDALGATAPAETLRKFHGIAPAERGRQVAEVEIQVLGAFSIRRRGEPLTWPRKVPRRPLELLKALIASGTDGAPVERLTDMVWPGLEGDNARKAFSTALYRLRKLLNEGALVLNAGRLQIAPETVWVDALAFESAVATGAPRREDLALYAGPLLSEDNESWLLSSRNRLAEMHRTATCRVGEGLLARGQWREALEVYGSALQRDSVAEVFYQGAIAACLAGGLRAEASALFERCRKEMSEQLGLSPSSKTLALYQSVIRNS